MAPRRRGAHGAPAPVGEERLRSRAGRLRQGNLRSAPAHARGRRLRSCSACWRAPSTRMNDLADVEADRVHPVKRNRPIASGRVPVRGRAVLGGVLRRRSRSAGRLTCGLAFAAGGAASISRRTSPTRSGSSTSLTSTSASSPPASCCASWPAARDAHRRLAGTCSPAPRCSRCSSASASAATSSPRPTQRRGSARGARVVHASAASTRARRHRRRHRRDLRRLHARSRTRALLPHAMAVAEHRVRRARRAALPATSCATAPRPRARRRRCCATARSSPSCCSGSSS